VSFFFSPSQDFMSPHPCVWAPLSILVRAFSSWRRLFSFSPYEPFPASFFFFRSTFFSLAESARALSPLRARHARPVRENSSVPAYAFFGGSPTANSGPFPLGRNSGDRRQFPRRPVDVLTASPLGSTLVPPFAVCLPFQRELLFAEEPTASDTPSL